MTVKGKPHKVLDANRTFVEGCIMAGIPQAEVAGCLNICVNTLKKHYRYEIVTSLNQLGSKAAKCLEDAINSGSVDAAKYVLSRKFDWREKVEGKLDVYTQSDDEEYEDLTKLSLDELKIYAALKEKTEHIPETDPE